MKDIEIQVVVKGGRYRWQGVMSDGEVYTMRCSSVPEALRALADAYEDAAVTDYAQRQIERAQ